MSTPEIDPTVTVPAMPEVEVPDVGAAIPAMPTVDVPVPSIPNVAAPEHAQAAVDNSGIPSVDLGQYAAAPDPYNVYAQPAPMPAPAPDPYAAYAQPAPAPVPDLYGYGQPAPAPAADPYAFGQPAPAPAAFAAYGQPAPVPAYGAAPLGYDAPAYVMAPTIVNATSNGLGIAAMSCGIAGLVFMWVPVLGLLLGIAGIVLGAMSMGACNRNEANNRGMAIAGIVCGAVATFFALIFNIAYLAAATQ